MLKPSQDLWATAFSFSCRITSGVHTCLYLRDSTYTVLTSVLFTYVPACVYHSLYLSDIPVSCYLSPTHILSFKAVYLSLSLPFQLVHSLGLSLLVSFCLSDGPSAERNYFPPNISDSIYFSAPFSPPCQNPDRCLIAFFGDLWQLRRIAPHIECARRLKIIKWNNKKPLEVCVCSQAASQRARLLCYQSVSSTKWVLQDFICSIWGNQVQNRTSNSLLW